MGRRARRFGVAILFALSACSDSPDAPRALPDAPNVLIVLIDTLRPDRLGSYGNPRGLTPFLDGVAAQSAVFEHAYSTTSWTAPAVASLFTSRYPSQHRVVTRESRLAPSDVTLAELLRDRGYRTGGFTANFRLQASHGYAQGFEHWQVLVPAAGSKPRASLFPRHVLGWLDAVSAETPDAPVLLYLHYMEPHAPYDPPEVFRRRFALEVDRDAAPAALNDALLNYRWGSLTHADAARLAALYDGEVAFFDAELRLIFGMLRRRGFLDDAVVVILSDHGEEFGEHDRMLHGFTLFEQSVRIPLIVRLPDWSVIERVEAPVSIIDVAPTLLELVAGESAASFEGRPLLPLLREGAARPEVRTELHYDGIGDEPEVRVHTGALLRPPLKLLFALDGATPLFDLEADPGETAPLVGVEAEAATAGLAAAYAAQTAELQGRANATSPMAPLDDETRERLRALGYSD